MLRAHHAISALLPVIFAVGVGCAGEIDDPIATGEEESVTSPPPVIGTFRDEHTAAGVAVLTLMTDSTYHIEKAVVCVRFPCPRPQANGLYRYARRGNANLLVLMDDRGRTIEEYKYLLRGNILNIALNLDNSQWQALSRSEVSWCGEPKDCSLQNLPVGPCSGNWLCPSSSCRYSCGPLERGYVDEVASIPIDPPLATAK